MRNLVATRLTGWTVIRPIIISLLNHEGQPTLFVVVRKLYITTYSASIVGQTDITGEIKIVVFCDLVCFSPSLKT